MSDKECCCVDWAKKVKDYGPFHELCITFICEQHGQITIDGRELPIQYVHNERRDIRRNVLPRAR